MHMAVKQQKHEITLQVNLCQKLQSKTLNYWPKHCAEYIKINNKYKTNTPIRTFWCLYC